MGVAVMTMLTIVLRSVFPTVDPVALSLLLCYYSFDRHYSCYFNYPNSIVTVLIVYIVVIASSMVEGSFTIICRVLTM